MYSEFGSGGLLEGMYYILLLFVCWIFGFKGGHSEHYLRLYNGTRNGDPRSDISS